MLSMLKGLAKKIRRERGERSKLLFFSKLEKKLRKCREEKEESQPERKERKEERRGENRRENKYFFLIFLSAFFVDIEFGNR